MSGPGKGGNPGLPGANNDEATDPGKAAVNAAYDAAAAAAAAVAYGGGEYGGGGAAPSTISQEQENQMSGSEFGFEVAPDGNNGGNQGNGGHPSGQDPTDEPDPDDGTGPVDMGVPTGPLGGNPNDESDQGGDDSGPGGKPIVLDLDGDGVELVALEDSTTFYDINGDGYRERMAWAPADDGFLAYDKDGDGIISAHDELSFVSYVEGARTDLEGLAYFDTNDDGVLDAQDAEWSKFRVWQDLDQDGESGAGELRTLD